MARRRVGKRNSAKRRKRRWARKTLRSVSKELEREIRLFRKRACGTPWEGDEFTTAVAASVSILNGNPGAGRKG